MSFKMPTFGMNTSGSKRATTFIPFHTNYNYGADDHLKDEYET